VPALRTGCWPLRARDAGLQLARDDLIGRGRGCSTARRCQVSLFGSAWVGQTSGTGWGAIRRGRTSRGRGRAPDTVVVGETPRTGLRLRSLRREFPWRDPPGNQGDRGAQGIRRRVRGCVRLLCGSVTVPEAMQAPARSRAGISCAMGKTPSYSTASSQVCRQVLPTTQIGIGHSSIDDLDEVGPFSFPSERRRASRDAPSWTGHPEIQ